MKVTDIVELSDNKEVVLIDKLKKPVLKNEWDEILKKEDKSLNLNH